MSAWEGRSDSLQQRYPPWNPPMHSPSLSSPSSLERLQPRVVSFEEPVTFIRESLAEQWVKEEEWSKAAGVLAGIDLDSGEEREVVWEGNGLQRGRH